MKRTVKYGICNQATRINGFAIDGGKWFAITLLEVTSADIFTLQLVSVQALHVATMILEEVGELIVEEYGVLQFHGHGKFHDALELLGDICYAAVSSVVDKGIMWSFSDFDLVIR